jgi:hypothetical protein
MSQTNKLFLVWLTGRTTMACHNDKHFGCIADCGSENSTCSPRCELRGGGDREDHAVCLIAALFPIDLNQVPGRYDQGFRFGSANLKAAFWLGSTWRT